MTEVVSDSKTLSGNVCPESARTIGSPSIALSGSLGIFCALISEDRVPATLEDARWDELFGFGMPGEVISYRGGKETRRYCRFGGDDGHEPLIFVRDFHGSHPDYLEVAEEFRHYFNLFEGKANGIFVGGGRGWGRR